MTDRMKPLDPASLARVTGGAAPHMRVGSASSETIFGSNGNDAIDAGGGNDTVLGQGGHDLLLGGDGSDMLLGGTGYDTLVGGAGDDTCVWWPGDGSEVVEGGAGVDTLHLRDVPGSLEQVLAMIVVEPGSPLPGIRDGAIDLTGVRGAFLIGGERISFSGLERAEVTPARGS